MNAETSDGRPDTQITGVMVKKAPVSGRPGIVPDSAIPLRKEIQVGVSQARDGNFSKRSIEDILKSAGG